VFLFLNSSGALQSCVQVSHRWNEAAAPLLPRSLLPQRSKSVRAVQLARARMQRW